MDRQKSEEAVVLAIKFKSSLRVNTAKILDTSRGISYFDHMQKKTTITSS